MLARLRKDRLVAAANSESGAIGSAFKNKLQSLRELDSVGDVRGLGLLWGVEFVKNKSSKEPFPAELNFAGKVGEAARQRGVLVYPMQGCVDGYKGDHLLLAPPAIISQPEIEQGVSELAKAIAEAEAALKT